MAKKPKKELSDSDRKMFQAIEADDLEGVRAVLRGGANPSARQGKWPAAAYACGFLRSHAMVSSILDAGANLSDLRGQLGWAIRFGTPELVDALLESGADVTTGLPLVAAAQKDDPELIRRLLAAGADIDFREPLKEALRSRPACWAAACALIEAGADFSKVAQDWIGGTVLNFAVYHDRVDVIEALVAAQADLNEEGVVRAGGDIKLIRKFSRPDDPELKLIEAIFYPEQPGAVRSRLAGLRRHAIQPLILATALGRERIVAILLRAGADPNRKDGVGATAYEWAAELGHTEIMRHLENAGGAVRDDSPEELLLAAAERGDISSLDALLPQVTSIDARDQRKPTENRSALMLAAANGHAQMVRALVAAGADPNLTDNPTGERGNGFNFVLREGGRHDLIESGVFFVGQTALMCAASAGHAEVVRALAQMGADVNFVDLAGWTALDVASEAGHTHTVEAMTELGGRSGKEFSKKKRAFAPTAAKPSARAKKVKPTAPKQPTRVDTKRAATNDGFQSLIAQLSAACGKEPQPMPNVDGGVLFHLPEGRAASIGFEPLRENARAHGASLVYWGGQRESLALLPTTDKYFVIQAMGTSADNYGFSTSDIIKRLRGLERKQDFSLIGVGPDSIEGKFVTPIENPAEIAKLLYETCDSVVDYLDAPEATVECLAEELVRSPNFTLWWD